MSRVWKIATVSGIPIQIHWSFSFVFLWIAYEGNKYGLTWEETLTFGLLLMGLFGCVVLHEFGHALAARRYGVSTKDITLSPIGGVARLNKLPEKPIQEFVVAIAGPLVNVLIALLIAITFFILSKPFFPVLSTNPILSFSDPSNYFQWLFFLNLILAMFNLLPAFPMDGGRMVRALLSMKLGRLKATRIASFIGRLIAIVLLATAIYNWDILFAFVSLFVFVMASYEYYMVRREDVLNNKTIADVPVNSFTPLRDNDSMRVAIEAFQKGKETNFIIFNEREEFCGVLTEMKIQKAIEGGLESEPIENSIDTTYGAILLDDKINAAYLRMNDTTFSILPVYDSNKLIGLIEFKQLSEFISNKVRTPFSI
ncbi:MAG: M50 family metallopeptidase [Saprospiraceae bacterium]